MAQTQDNCTASSDDIIRRAGFRIVSRPTDDSREAVWELNGIQFVQSRALRYALRSAEKKRQLAGGLSRQKKVR